MAISFPSLCTNLKLLILSCWAVCVQAQRPNILICIGDDISYPHMGAYGCNWVSTPHFDAIAQEGVLFSAAYTPNAKCAPSRSCLLTGRNPWQIGAAMNHFPYFPVEFTTYMEALTTEGYAIGYTGKGWAPGDPGMKDGKKRQLVGPSFSTEKLSPPTSGISSIDYAANFHVFLDQKDAEQPFCFWFGSNEPHRAYEFRSGVTKGGKQLSDLPSVPAYWPDNDTVRHDLLDYALEIEHFDTHVGRMRSILSEKGLLDNTIIIVLADHGMPFPRVKGQPYEDAHHIPLAMCWPGGIEQQGRVVPELVSIVDLTATILELAELTPSDHMQPLSGYSLVPFLHAQAIDWPRKAMVMGKERHDIGRPHDWGYPIRSILRDSLLYIYNFEPARWPQGNPETGYLNCDGSPIKTWLIRHYNDPFWGKYWRLNLGKRPAEELYDLRKDPRCIHNLAQVPAYGLLKASLRDQLIETLSQEGDRRMFGRGAEYEAYPYSGSRRGFYDRYVNQENPPFPKWVSPSDMHWVRE